MGEAVELGLGVVEIGGVEQGGGAVGEEGLQARGAAVGVGGVKAQAQEGKQGCAGGEEEAEEEEGEQGSGGGTAAQQQPQPCHPSQRRSHASQHGRRAHCLSIPAASAVCGPVPVPGWLAGIAKNRGVSILAPSAVVFT